MVLGYVWFLSARLLFCASDSDDVLVESAVRVLKLFISFGKAIIFYSSFLELERRWKFQW